MAILDDDGQPVVGQPGEIAIDRHHPNTMLEYWRNPEATKEKFLGDWLLTGDLGAMDEDGYVWFVSRKDDVINSAGYRIGPGEIEGCLGGHEAVAMSAVIGVPDERRGEVPKAFVVLRPGVRAERRAGRRAAPARAHPPGRATRCRARSCSSTTCRRPRPARSCGGPCAIQLKTRSLARFIPLGRHHRTACTLWTAAPYDFPMPWPSHRSIDGGIDRIPLPDSPGELWLCGKHVTGPDAEAAMARVGATTIVCLNERHELEERYPDYVAWLVAHRGDRAVWFPIPDLHAPPVETVVPVPRRPAPAARRRRAGADALRGRHRAGGDDGGRRADDDGRAGRGRAGHRGRAPADGRARSGHPA